MQFYAFVKDVTQALKNAIESVNNVRVELISSFVEELSVAGNSKESNKTPYIYGVESESCKSCSVILPISKDVKTKDDLIELITQWFDFLVEAYELKEAKAARKIAHGIRKSADIEQRNAFRPNSSIKVPKRVSFKIDKVKGLDKVDTAKIEALRLKTEAAMLVELKKLAAEASK